MINFYKTNTQKETGLFLLPAPTGSGKTYQAVRFLYESLAKSPMERQIIFCSNRIATSITDPYGNLIRLIDENHDKSEAESLKARVLPLYSDPEQFRRFFEKDWRALLPHKFLDNRTTRERFENLKNILSEHGNGRFKLDDEYIHQQVNACKKEIANYLAAQRDEIMQNKQIDFAEASQKVFKNERKWLVQLLPSYYFDEFDVVFTTFHKLMHGFTSQSGVKNLIFSPGEDNRKRIFLIDEFDTTKRILLDHLSKGETITDLVGEFLRLVPARPFSKEHVEIAMKVSKARKKMEELAAELNLDVPLKASGFGFQSSYIFQDDTLIYSKELGSSTKLCYDKREGINRIINDKERPCHSLIGVVNQLGFFVNITVPKTIRFLAYAYQKAQKEKGFEIDLKDAMRTVMARLNYTPQQHQELLRRIELLRGAKSAWKISRGGLRNFYERGFSWFTLRDDESHREDTHIHYESMRLTPEQTILSLAQRHRIVGISATSELKGLFFNYDIDFLASRLGENFDLLSEEELDELQGMAEGGKDYSNVSIEAEFIDASDLDAAIRRATNRFYGNKKEIGRFLANDFMAEAGAHEKARVLTLFCFLIEFVEKSMQSFIYFGNNLKTFDKHKKALRKLLRTWLLESQRNFSGVMITRDPYGFWKNVGKKEWMDKRLDDILSFVETVGAARYREEYEEAIAGKERFFVYTTYGSLKEGVNLHYAFDQKLRGDLACIFSEKRDECRRDIEAIFLEKPTYLFDQGAGSGYVLRRDLYALLAMHQAADRLGKFERREGERPWEASRRIKAQYVRRLFAKSAIPEGGTGENILFRFYEHYLPEHFAFDVVANAKQTIGRICRAPYKSHTVRIYLDAFYKAPIEIYARSDESERILHLREFDAVVKEAMKEEDTAEKPESKDLFAAHTIYANEKGRMEIHDTLETIVRGRDNPSLMETARRDWEGLRDFVLRYPTLPNLEDVTVPGEGSPLKISPPQNIYTRLEEKGERYWHKGDPERIVDASRDERAGWKEVSGRLLDLCRNVGGVMEHLEKKGYATRWEKGCHILTPIMFNNIYKGALGEVVGDFLMRKWIGVGLLPLDDGEYELFDAKTEAGVYVDFKNFSERTTGGHEISERLKRDVMKKISENPHVKKVALVNLMADGARRIRYYHADFTHCENPVEATILDIPNLIDAEAGAINRHVVEGANRLKEWMENG